jgi:hypothetical protein
MLINVALKLNFTFISSVRNGSCHLKKLNFRHFLIINFEKLQQAYETQKNVTSSAKDRPNL